ncbi:DUF1707 domain-containing protein [Nocardioidaceae bacterium]|nr:DUF1707 domain-containing protein [Nocardioidaceae bacterium]
MADRDDSQLRVGHAERDEVAEQLRLAAGDGMLDLEELEERLEAAHAARTRADLARLVVDLPPAPAMPGAVERAPGADVANRSNPGVLDADERWRDGALVLRTVMGDCSRRGVWVVPARIWARSVMGSVTIDLREAELGRRTEIEAQATLGDVTVLVNSSTRVEIVGRGVLGDFTEGRATVAARLRGDSPVVVVTGRAVLGSVTVKRRGMPGELRRMLLGR